MIVGLFILLAFGCTNNEVKGPKDTTTEGTIHISVEESFRPIIEQQIKVFESSNPNAHIIAEYKSEIECLKDFTEDSTRMVIVTRGLTKSEDANFYKQLGFHPTFGILAYNAIAVITNKVSKDTIFSMQDLSDRLTGKVQGPVVMDGTNLTGIVRFLKDSLVKNQPFGKNVKAANNSNEALDYIKNNTNAIGFVGMNWISDVYDPAQEKYRKYIKNALIECTLCIEKNYYSQPSQSTISEGHYSLALPVYFILKENAPGLGSGFLNFMSLERGQLIFRRAFLVPIKIGFKNRKGMIDKQ
jgi:phosphate transport system substrate-binding protein